MMWWQMYPFPHTCPVGSVGGAGGGRLAKEAGVGVSLKAWGSAIRVTQTLSVSLWISLSPHLTRSESHWFSICVVLSMSLILFLSSFFLVHWPSHTACRILVPQPRMEPMPPALEVQGLNHWAARKVPRFPSALLWFTAQQWEHPSPPRFQSSVTLPRLYTYIQSSFYIVAKDHIFRLSNGAPPVSPCGAPASARRRRR